MPTKRPYLLAAALWLAMVAVFFWPVIFQGKVLAPLDIMDSLLRPWATAEKIELHNAFTYDAISQYLPYDYSVYQSLRQDGYIGWNPYTHSGTSIVENTMICPGDWHHHLYRFLPFWDAWNLGIILQFTLAGLGMLVLLRYQKIPAAYALIGVVAFGFYSQFTLWIYHRWVLGAMCWAPWIVWSLLRAREKNRLIDPLSVIFIALAFRGGHLQACLTIVLMVVFVALADWWRAPSKFAPAQIFRSFTPYALTGFLAAILSLDVLIETVPALLHGGKSMVERPWSETLMAVPTLASSFIPTLTGSPQGLDAAKFFHIDLFSIKFMGACALLLAIGGCASKKAPFAAKVLLLAGLLLPFTPADKWLYSRFTSVFALGGAWLAAWYLYVLSKCPRNPLLWKRVFTVAAAMAVCWFLASLVIHWQAEFLTAKLHDIVAAELPANKSSRSDWMFARSSVFLETLKIWHPLNLVFLICITGGLLAISHIHVANSKSKILAICAALFAFGEMFTFSRNWVSFSERPDGPGLYSTPEWVHHLKEEVNNRGTILCYDRSDADYLHLNTPSAYGIRFAEGYETVMPERIDPHGDERFDPYRCAAAGISHLLASPEMDPGSIDGWEKAIESGKFVLYRNPQFTSICHAELDEGPPMLLATTFKSPNRREIEIPAGTRTITLLESFNPGWRYSTDGETWAPVKKTDHHAIQVDLSHPTTVVSTRLLLQYRPAYQAYYRPVIGITLAGLLAFGVLRYLRMRAKPLI